MQYLYNIDMISFLNGDVKMRGDRFVIINVGGIGYKVFAPPEVLSMAGKTQKIELWTHLSVRENALDLYGFKEYPELEFFEVLIQISGIGPKTALGVLSTAPVDTIKKAIASGEISYLTKVSGIGKKTAERVVVELRDKMGAMDAATSIMFKEDEDVLQALQSLGYGNSEIREAIKNISNDASGVNARIKEALRILGK
ncbi:TPA: Holliday junction branch migration protein RuvA [Patescibacteria group bacterium]|nr:MAG: Holliday junction ATP-dependent DNA helicase RuvA [Parcubacteria group bacterium GW2011_GWF2_40_10]KKR59763.1 MAG: Holliday junction ATP-dependent DNA helicase RuvA [Parcubacteria group bacterium GW2011_GWC2_40_31]KKR75284.1 MAG: Holliday junction ATP-dependent DNA helicase RuvA [Parcubacteria group bacterium GW2011_GWB2_40_8]KKR77357.1 MAG: Holliday junction ATP-dependent DNA helicase RuvA [Parcubacteria group bacterium GW2011_GWE2_40_8]KKR82540.1 MAG: Holliday junction ATP-dependent D